MPGFHDPLEGSFGSIMPFDDLRALTFFLDQLHRREKEVQKESPLGGIELIEVCNRVFILQTVIAEVLTNMGPVLAFHVSVIVFVILSGTGIVHGAFSVGEVLQQRPI
jgi:hypothetical protein